MIRRILNGVYVAAVVLMLAIPSKAVETGSILLQTSGGAVALYRVGTINGQSFLLNEEYGGEAVTMEETFSPNLAAWLDGQSKSGIIKAPDIYGKVLFSDLEPGLYLLSQRSAPVGSELFQPFLVSLPWDGTEWDLSIDTDQTETQPVTEDAGRPAAWLVGMMLSALGLAVCIRQGRGIA